MSEDYNHVVTSVLGRVQHNHTLRKIVGVLIVLAFVGGAGYFIYDLLPRRHHITLTGGEITSNRHFLAKVLEEEARENGVEIKLVPTRGSIEALEKLESGELDFAFSQGGLEPNYSNIVHVATLAPELIHFIVKPEIETVRDLRNKVINLGGKSGGTRIVAQNILRQSGLTEGVDYVETNYGGDKLIAMRPDQLPDVVVSVSLQPSFIADFLVKERGYKLLEIAFPGSYALRLGWVADSTILGYTYGVDPPVPENDIKAVGVNLHLLANAEVPDRVVRAVLETLYSPSVASRTRLPFDEADMLKPSGFPLSPGALAFAARKEPLLSPELMEQAKAAAGLAFSLFSGLMIALRWFRGKPIQEEFDDATLKNCVAEIAGIERQAVAADAAERAALDQRLSDLKTGVLVRMADLKLKDPTLVNAVLAAEAGARARLQS